MIDLKPFMFAWYVPRLLFNQFIRKYCYRIRNKGKNLGELISFQVYAVASEDMDSLTFGAPRFLRHLMDPSSRKIPVMEFDVSKVLVLFYGLVYCLTV